MWWDEQAGLRLLRNTVSTKASFKVKVEFLTLDGFFNRRESILRLCLLPKLYLVDLRAVQLLITTQNRREIKPQHSNIAILSQPIQTLTNIIMGKRIKVGPLVKNVY